MSFQQTSYKIGGIFTWLQHPRPLFPTLASFQSRIFMWMKLTLVFAEPFLVSGQIFKDLKCSKYFLMKLTFIFAEPSLVSGPADALVPTLPLVCWRALTLLALVTTEKYCYHDL